MLSVRLISSIDRAGQIDARGSTKRGRLTCAHEAKARHVVSRCPVDTGNRVADPTGQAYARRRPRSIAGLSGQRRRKSRLEPLIRRRAPPPVEAGPDVIDDFPMAIPVTPRELDVIES